MEKDGMAAELSGLRRGAIDINHSFAGMAPLLRRVRLLALNAEITSHRLGERGASFGVVVKEVNSMAAELRELVGEAENAFWEVVNIVARWIIAENMMAISQRAVDAIRADGNGQGEEEGKTGRGPFRWRNALEEGTGREWEREARSLDGESAEGRLWLSIIAKRRRIARLLFDLGELAGKLSAMIDRVNLVAARKSNFLAVSAMIESSRIGDGGLDLTTVAENIRTLANDIAAVEKEAMDRVHSLRSLSSRLGSAARKTAGDVLERRTA